ncbi:hypothetical protein [Spiroplasma sp. ChiS]|nr:hypothetical protein [Spiroplasma sp. ChiS]
MKKILNLMGTISITFSGIIPLIGMTSNYENKIMYYNILDIFIFGLP